MTKVLKSIVRRIEITVSTRDVHGNIALATDIQFEYEDPLGMIKASTKGDGYWIIEGGEMGEWNLRLSAGSCKHRHSCHSFLRRCCQVIG